MDLLNQFLGDIDELTGILGGRLTEWQEEAQEELVECLAYRQEMAGTDQEKNVGHRARTVASRLRNSLALSLEAQNKLPARYYRDLRR